MGPKITSDGVSFQVYQTPIDGEVYEPDFDSACGGYYSLVDDVCDVKYCHPNSFDFARVEKYTQPYLCSDRSPYLNSKLGSNSEWIKALSAYAGAVQNDNVTAEEDSFQKMLDIIAQTAELTNFNFVDSELKRLSAENPTLTLSCVEHHRVQDPFLLKQTPESQIVDSAAQKWGREREDVVKWMESTLTTVSKEKLDSNKLRMIAEKMEDVGLSSYAYDYFMRASKEAPSEVEEYVFKLRAIQQLPEHEMQARFSEIEEIRWRVAPLLTEAARWERELSKQPPEPTILLPKGMDGLPFEALPDDYPTLYVDVSTLDEAQPSIMGFNIEEEDGQDEFQDNYSRLFGEEDGNGQTVDEQPVISTEKKQNPIIVLYEGVKQDTSRPPGTTSQVRKLYALAWSVAYAIRPNYGLELEREEITHQILEQFGTPSAHALHKLNELGIIKTPRLPDLNNYGKMDEAELTLHLSNAKHYVLRHVGKGGVLEEISMKEEPSVADDRWRDGVLSNVRDVLQIGSKYNLRGDAVTELEQGIKLAGYVDGSLALEHPRWALEYLAQFQNEGVTKTLDRYFGGIKRKAPWVFDDNGNVNPNVDVSETKWGELAKLRTRSQYLVRGNFGEVAIPFGLSSAGVGLGLLCGPFAPICSPFLGALGGYAGSEISEEINTSDYSYQIDEAGETGLSRVTDEERRVFESGAKVGKAVNIGFGALPGLGVGVAGAGLVTREGVKQSILATVRQLQRISLKNALSKSFIGGTLPRTVWKGFKGGWTGLRGMKPSNRFLVYGGAVSADYGFLGKRGELDHPVGYAGLVLAGMDPAVIAGGGALLKKQTWQVLGEHLSSARLLTADTRMAIGKIFQSVFKTPESSQIPRELLESGSWGQKLAAHYNLLKLRTAGAVPELVPVGWWKGLKGLGSTILWDMERAGLACFEIDLANQELGAEKTSISTLGGLCLFSGANGIAVKVFHLDRGGSLTSYGMDRLIGAGQQVAAGKSIFNLDGFLLGVPPVVNSTPSLILGRINRTLIGKQGSGLPYVKAVTIRSGALGSRKLRVDVVSAEERELLEKLVKPATLNDALTAYHPPCSQFPHGAIGKMAGKNFQPTAVLNQSEAKIMRGWLQTGAKKPAEMDVLFKAQDIVGGVVGNESSRLLYYTTDIDRQRYLLGRVQEAAETLQASTDPLEKEAAMWLLNEIKFGVGGKVAAGGAGAAAERKLLARQVLYEITQERKIASALSEGLPEAPQLVAKRLEERIRAIEKMPEHPHLPVLNSWLGQIRKHGEIPNEPTLFQWLRGTKGKPVVDFARKTAGSNGIVTLKLNIDLNFRGRTLFGQLHDTIRGGLWDYAVCETLLGADGEKCLYFAWSRGLTTLALRNEMKLRGGWDTVRAGIYDKSLKVFGDPIAGKFSPFFISKKRGFLAERYDDVAKAEGLEAFLDEHIGPAPWEGGVDSYNMHIFETLPKVVGAGVELESSPYDLVGDGWASIANLYASDTDKLSDEDWNRIDGYIHTMLTDAEAILGDSVIRRRNRHSSGYDSDTILKHAAAFGMAAWHGAKRHPERFKRTLKEHPEFFRLMSDAFENGSPPVELSKMFDGEMIRFFPR